MNLEEPHIPYEAIAAFFANEISEGGKRDLEHWVGTNQQNKRTFFELKRLWNARPYNADKAWWKRTEFKMYD